MQLVPLHGGEIEAAVRKKMGGVMGKGCVVSCMLARDFRHLDKVAMEWQAMTDKHLQVLIRENNLRVAIKELGEEAEGGGGAGGIADDDGGESGGMAAQNAARGSLPPLFSPPSPSSPPSPPSPHFLAPLPGGGAGGGKKVTLAHGKLAALRKSLAEAETLREELRASVGAALSAFNAARSDYLHDVTPSPSAVVVFSRQMDAVIASQVQLDTHFGRWHTEAAAGPNDLVWHNVALTSKQRFRKNVRARAIAAFMVLFFMVPVNGLVWILSEARQPIVDFFGESLFKVLIGLVLTIFLVLGHIISLVLSRQYGGAVQLLNPVDP
jgi:hypothetical protein